MVKFIYNNEKYDISNYLLFELNCGYYSHISFINKADLYFKSFLAKKLTKKLKNFMFFY